MRSASTWTKAALVGVGIGLGVALVEPVAAQLMQLTDNTWASKVVLYNSAGAEQSVGGGTQYAEDAAHTNGDLGNVSLCVRDDTLNIRSGAENDYEPCHTNADGAIWTIDVNSAAALTALQIMDDWDESDRAKVNLIAGQAGITAGAGAVGASTPRVTLASDDPGIVALQALDASIPAVAALADDTANPSLSAIAAYMMVFDGTTWDRARLASDMTVGSAFGTSGPGILGSYKEFDGAALPTTTNVGTEEEANPFAVSLQGVQYVMLLNEDGSKQLGKLEDDAHATADYAMPILTRRIDTAASSAGTSGDYATLDTDGLGRLWVRPGGPCEDHARISSAAINTASSGNVEIVALNGSDLIYICAVDVVVDAAVDIQLIYGTGTACATGETDLTGPWGFGANGGITKNKGVGPYYVVPAGNAFCVELSGAVQTSGSVSYVRTATP